LRRGLRAGSGVAPRILSLSCEDRRGLSRRRVTGSELGGNAAQAARVTGDPRPSPPVNEMPSPDGRWVRLVCPKARRVIVSPNVIVPSAKSGASSGRSLGRIPGWLRSRLQGVTSSHRTFSAWALTKRDRHPRRPFVGETRLARDAHGDKLCGEQPAAAVTLIVVPALHDR
jgi:hypothetical protein